MEERETDAEGRVRFEHIVPGTHRFWPKELDADDGDHYCNALELLLSPYE